MKKLIGLLFILSLAYVSLNGQVGFNMSNSTTAIKSLADSNELLTLIPDGGTLSYRYRFDSGKENNANFIKLYSWLEKRNRHLQVIFCAGDSVDNVSALNTLKLNGVKIEVIECQNEAFYPAGGYNFTWAKYEPVLLRMSAEFKPIYPDAYLSIPLAPRASDAGVLGGNGSHKKWNDAAFAFINSSDLKLAVSIHIYYNSNEIPQVGTSTDETGTGEKGTFPIKRVFTGDNNDLTYWTNVYNQRKPAALFDPELNYIHSRCDVPVYVTETGIVGTGYLNGSYVHAAVIFELMNLYGQDSRVNSFNIHAGIGNSRTSTLAPRQTFDNRDLENLYNVTTPSWDAVTLYLSERGSIINYFEQPVLSEGEYFLWFLNNGTEINPTFNLEQGLKAEFSVHSISATKINAIGTSMAFTNKGSVIGQDITGITEGKIINPISFGYVRAVVTRSCYDTTYTVMDTSYITTYTPAECPKRCSRFFYSLFNVKTCSGCGVMIETKRLVLTPRIVTEEICN
jgi:hypothetical protein